MKYFKNRDLEKILREIRIVLSMVLIAVLIVQTVKLPDAVGNAVAKRFDPAINNINGTLGNVNATTTTLKQLIEQISKDYKDPKNPGYGLYWDIAAMITSSTESSRITEETLEDVRAALIGGRDTKGTFHEGVFPVATGLLNSTKNLMEDARKDLNTLTDSANKALIPLKGTMENIEKLSADLERQMKEGGNLDKTFQELAKSVEDFNKLLENEDIQKILASSARTSEHLAESAKSVDIALQPWRKKANQLKMILGKLAGMLKIVYAF